MKFAFALALKHDLALELSDAAQHRQDQVADDLFERLRFVNPSK